MSDVADHLGKSEYDSFPSIQKEIFDASQDVRVQVNGLFQAIQELGVILHHHAFIKSNPSEAIIRSKERMGNLGEQLLVDLNKDNFTLKNRLWY